jgi:hypothetical protein
MGQKLYKIGEPIQVIYQPDKAKSGKTVTMEIYDETGAKDTLNFPDVTMTEIDTTGRYEGSFTPDAVGDWVIMISYDSNKGYVVKNYSVGNYNIESIGITLDNVDSNVSAIPPIIS